MTGYLKKTFYRQAAEALKTETLQEKIKTRTRIIENGIRFFTHMAEEYNKNTYYPQDTKDIRQHFVELDSPWISQAP